MFRRVWALAFMLFALVGMSIWPAFNPRTRTVHFDINNGRQQVVEKLFGLTFRNEIVGTNFTRLVVQYRLEDEPEWVATSHSKLSLTGDIRSNSLRPNSKLPGYYRQFTDEVYPYSSIDDTTTYILEMRRLAKSDYGRGVGDLLSSITEQADSPNKKAVYNEHKTRHKKHKKDSKASEPGSCG